MKKKTLRDLQEETNEKVNQIWTAFFGVPDTNDKGMYGEFQNVKRDYYNFKRWCIGIVSFAVGSGSLGFGIFKLAEWVG